MQAVPASHHVNCVQCETPDFGKFYRCNGDVESEDRPPPSNFISCPLTKGPMICGGHHRSSTAISMFTSIGFDT